MRTETDYTAVTRYSSFIFEPAKDAKDCLSNILKILGGKRHNISEYRMMRIRNVNIDFLQGRLPTLEGDNYRRALDTMNNLRQ